MLALALEKVTVMYRLSKRAEIDLQNENRGIMMALKTDALIQSFLCKCKART